ncbi:hypothetical protein C7M51_02852 [Mixta intestinalis]|uniref:Uncharacterized protein n=1 Tax=Mixta intestinalis TaxID=1615494 RepID=A0A6P1Q357_9GAMM|nr:hypothetical protein C7M51_02852 [Mixta intestinalis]
MMSTACLCWLSLLSPKSTAMRKLYPSLESNRLREQFRSSRVT